MERAQISTRVIELIRQFFALPDSDILTEETTFESLGMDSLDLVEVALTIEDDLGFEFPEDIIDIFTTVGNVVDHTDKILNKTR